MISERNNWLLDIALDHLTPARVQLYRALLTPGGPSAILSLKSQIPLALSKLREATSLDHLPGALLTAALHAGAVLRDATKALEYLAEAEMIATRGPMPLHLADVHLHRARLGSMRTDTGEKIFPTVNAKAELEKARVLIERHHYYRRRDELNDATAAALHWLE